MSTLTRPPHYSANYNSGLFSQVLSTALVAGSYRVRLYGAQRNSASADQVVRVLLNGREVGRFQPALGFAQYTLPSATTSFTQLVAPVLTAVSPFIGVPGTVVSLTGTGLTNTTSITFTGAAGVKTVTSGFTVNAAGTQITGVVVPAGARSGPVLATTPLGTSLVGSVLFSRATSLAVGGYHTVAVRADGSLWAWGRNDAGQLGLGSTSDQTSPQRVGTATNWTSVAAGITHTLAVRADGSLWAWGRNDAGQLGLGSTSDQTSPQRVGTATNWTNVAAGNLHSLAVQANGTLWVWGSNADGQLGLGNTTLQTSPQRVGTATSWVSAAAGVYHTVAVQADGTLWAWGDNYYGQLGLGNTTLQTSPQRVGTATSWVSAAAGGFHSAGEQSCRVVWGWGDNSSGQVGDGSTTQRPSPVQVLGPIALFGFAPSRAGIGSTVAVTGTGLAGVTALSVNGINALASVTNNTAGASRSWCRPGPRPRAPSR
ncbi:RCC1 domain-containing protein [Hymenobacter sp. BRD67]|uniref:RCC1 domain-containing protein n=1 Tax=Hymenobacter sp. BRD67 TaxID=2675877 RepID=UPI001565A566|nr:hypothetical protein [Hymenobacter sp. BRD67]QKG54960.1 hypothetical protein GKZ67_21280 [Hymenobacter sp. BRD67]